MSRPLPLLLVGHGTRSARGVAEFGRLVERVRARRAAPVTDGGFIELASPAVAAAVARMIAAQAGGETSGAAPVNTAAEVSGAAPVNTAAEVSGAAPTDTEIVALPLVLTAAGHGKGDMPAALARERLRHGGLRFRYGRPLGPHPVLTELLAERVDAALARCPREGSYVLLAGRGSTDPDANAEVAKVARLLWEGRGYDEVGLSFISLAEPGVPAALDRARRLGARRIVVAPYFLFPGVLPDRVAAQSARFAAANPGIDVRVAGVLGDCDRLADLVVERYEEALHGDIRMNCDTCAYRVALPGFAAKVGQPQTPHDHPDDPAAGGHHHHNEHASDIPGSDRRHRRAAARPSISA
jgi:sirohydrochlorin cobaltochelatase